MLEADDQTPRERNKIGIETIIAYIACVAYVACVAGGRRSLSFPADYV